MTNAFRLALVAFFALLWVVACQPATDSETSKLDAPLTDATTLDPNNPAFKLAVAPPFDGVDVSFENYTINTSKDQTFSTPSGTQIHIPSDAFVDAEGNPVEGEVAIRYREFHSAKDIIASGIPMHDHETGDYMETAGMFEIRGEHNGKEVVLRADKKVRVDMASYVEGDQFNFYQLGPKDCRWQEKGTATPQPNLAKAQAIAALNQQLETTAKQWRTPEEVENMVFDMAVNYSKLPTLKAFKNVLWEYAGQEAELEKNEWIFEETWDDAQVEQTPEGNYELVLTTENKSYRTKVRPILSGKDQETALANFREETAANYERLQLEQTQERQRIETKADLLRSFEVTQMGICNWDTWIRRQQEGDRRCVVNPRFDELVSHMINEKPNKTSYFYVTNNRRSVIRYNNHSLNFFIVKSNEDPGVMIAILPDGSVALSSSEAIAAVTKGVENNAEITMPFVRLDQRIESTNDIDDLIEYGFDS